MISTSQILGKLKQRLEANKSGDTTLDYNEVTLPQCQGEPNKILTLIQNALKVNSLTLTLPNSTALPVLNQKGTSLTVAATISWKGISLPTESIFKVSPASILTLDLKISLPEGWKFSDSFSDFQYQRVNYLDWTKSVLLLTSTDHVDTAYFRPLKTGLNFFSTLQYQTDLKAITETATAIKTMEVGGVITRDNSGVKLSLSGRAALENLTIPLVGLPAMTMTGALVTIESTATTASSTSTGNETNEVSFLSQDPGGKASFAPLQVLVCDQNKKPISGVDVTFVVADNTPPKNMMVQIQPGNTEGPVLVKVKTNDSGIASLNKMGGKSVICSGAEGAFSIYATSSIANTVVFTLIVKSTPPITSPEDVTLTIISGNHQAVKRTVTPDVQGGQARFQPLKVKVTSKNGTPCKNTRVFFNTGTNPWQMSISLNSSGTALAVVTTDANGIATLNKCDNTYGIYAYAATGKFTVVASIENGPSIIFDDLEVTPLPTPTLKPLELSILQGNNQSQPRTDGISKTSTNTKNNEEKVVFTGTINQFGLNLTYELDIPGQLGGNLSCQMAMTTMPTLSKFSTALPVVAGSILDNLIPDTLKALSGISIDGLDYQFDPYQINATSVHLSLAVAAAKTYELIPSVILGKIGFSLDINYVPDKNLPDWNTSTNTPATTSTFSSIYTGMLYGNFNFGNLAVDTFLVIPSRGDWTLHLKPSVATTSANLDNVGNFTGETKAGILSTMPGFIKGLTGFTVDEIGISAAIIPPQNATNFTPTLSSVYFVLAQTQSWKIVKDLLTFSNWSIKTILTKKTSGWNTQGVLSGAITLGTGNNAPVFECELDIPAGESGWRISLAEEGFDISGLGDILKLIAADSINNFLPSRLQSFGNSHISVFEVFFDPTATPIIKQVGFQMNSTQPWELISDKGLVVNNVELGFTMYNGAQNTDKYTLGFIDGELTIAGHVLSVRAGRTNKTDPWIFEMMTVTVIPLTGLDKLAAWMFPSTVKTYTPTSIMPFSLGVDLIKAGFEFDLTSNTLNYVFIFHCQSRNLAPRSRFCFG